MTTFRPAAPRKKPLHQRALDGSHLWALRMVQPSMSDATDRGAYGEGSTGQRVCSTAAVPLLGGFVQQLLSAESLPGPYLIESGEYL